MNGRLYAVVNVPWGDRTKVGAVRGDFELGMRIEMVNAANGQRHIEQRWYRRSNVRPLARPLGHQHTAEWEAVIARARRTA